MSIPLSHFERVMPHKGLELMERHISALCEPAREGMPEDMEGYPLVASGLALNSELLNASVESLRSLLPDSSVPVGEQQVVRMGDGYAHEHTDDSLRSVCRLCFSAHFCMNAQASRCGVDVLAPEPEYLGSTKPCVERGERHYVKRFGSAAYGLQKHVGLDGSEISRPCVIQLRHGEDAASHGDERIFDGAFRADRKVAGPAKERQKMMHALCCKPAPEQRGFQLLGFRRGERIYGVVMNGLPAVDVVLPKDSVNGFSVGSGPRAVFLHSLPDGECGFALDGGRILIGAHSYADGRASDARFTSSSSGSGCMDCTIDATASRIHPVFCGCEPRRGVVRDFSGIGSESIISSPVRGASGNIIADRFSACEHTRWNLSPYGVDFRNDSRSNRSRCVRPHALAVRPYGFPVPTSFIIRHVDDVRLVRLSGVRLGFPVKYAREPRLEKFSCHASCSGVRMYDEERGLSPMDSASSRSFFSSASASCFYPSHLRSMSTMIFLSGFYPDKEKGVIPFEDNPLISNGDPGVSRTRGLQLRRRGGSSFYPSTNGNIRSFINRSTSLKSLHHESNDVEFYPPFYPQWQSLSPRAPHGRGFSYRNVLGDCLVRGSSLLKKTGTGGKAPDFGRDSWNEMRGKMERISEKSDFMVPFGAGIFAEVSK